MSEQNQNQNQKNASQSQNAQQARSAPSDAATPFFTVQQLWRTEAQRVLDETNSALERGFTEWERVVSESSRYGAAQAKAWHEASRAFIAGTRTIIG